MIQRLQSLYLLLTTLLSILFLNGTFLSFINKTGSALKVTFSGLFLEAQGANIQLLEKVLPLSVLFVIIPLFSLVIIFLFKNRILQLRLVMVLIIMNVLLILFSGYYAYIAITKYEAVFTPGFKMVLPVILLILSILAYRGIKKDELLVKSYDRLR
jgi:hypothetical protein